MAPGEVRANRLMWFAAGAAAMAIYLIGPHELYERGYALVESASLWVETR